MNIRLKSRRDLELMRAAGNVVRQALARATDIAKPGVTTAELDAAVFESYTKAGAKGLFKNYPTYRAGQGFPGNTCISVNDEVVHGIPSKRQLKSGDIVSVDCGVKLNGYCGDSAVTLFIGDVAAGTKRMSDVTRETLQFAIGEIKPGRRWSDIAKKMQDYVESRGFSVVRDFVGHGIGENMHEDPKVPNYIDSKFLKRGDFYLQPGMTLAIEPMVIEGKPETQQLDDGWTIVTKDGSAAAHWEHTVAVTPTGADVLTDGH
jgi:methionyl aminopeptidase